MIQQLSVRRIVSAVMLGAALALPVAAATGAVTSQGAAAHAARGGGLYASLYGAWFNIDPNTRNITHLTVRPSIFGIAYAHNYGACSPSDCDWGSTKLSGFPFASDTYIFGFATKHQTFVRSGDVLRVTTFTHFTDGSGRADYASTDYFRQGPAFQLGNWVNIDAHTGGITHLLLGQNTAGSYSVHAYGACSPTDCDWNTVYTQATSATNALATFNFGFKTAAISLRLSGSYLRADVVNHFTDSSRDYNATYFFSPAPTLSIGNWVNTDSHTGGITHVEISQAGDGSLIAHAYGACSPSDCDWNTTPVTAIGSQFKATFLFSFETNYMTLSLTGTTLRIDNLTHFTDSSGRADYTSTNYFTLS